MHCSTEELAKALRLTPEELKEKLEKNTLNLGQITIVSELTGLTPEETILRFFPNFMYQKSLKRRGRHAISTTR